MRFISVPRLLIFFALIVCAPIWKSTQFIAVSAIPTAYAQTVAPTCPPSYILSGNTCVRGAPAPSCPPGYIFSGRKCVAGVSNGPWAFVVTLSLGVKSALDLDGATLCVVSGSPSQVAASKYFHTNRLNIALVSNNTLDAAIRAYDRAACDVLVVEAGAANTTINGLSRPNDHGILPERIGGSAASSPPPIRRAAPPIRTAPPPPVDLATPLQRELKRIGCLTGRVDGVWGRGSQKALQSFAQRAGLNLGSEPSQNALNEARRRLTGFCPVRVAPKRTKPKGCRSGTVFLEGQCIPKSEVASFCGPGFTRSGSKCVSMAGREEQVNRCNSSDYAFCKPRAREYCEGDGSNSCINKETKTCLREEIGCTP